MLMILCEVLFVGVSVTLLVKAMTLGYLTFISFSPIYLSIDRSVDRQGSDRKKGSAQIETRFDAQCNIKVGAAIAALVW